MTQLGLDEFSGGVYEVTDPSDFGTGQWAELTGFELSSEVSIRSQWGVQALPAAPAGVVFKGVRGYTGRTKRWLVATSVAGDVYYMEAPSRIAASGVAATGTWTKQLGFAANADFRIMCEVPVGSDPTDQNAGLLLHSLSGTSPAVIMYESGGQMSTKLYTSFYPSLRTEGTTQIAESNRMPRANVACMWGDFLCLADVQWFKDKGTPGVLSSSNVKRYSNAFWISTPDNSGVPSIDTFHPVFSLNTIGGPEAIIIDMVRIDAGMLVFTTSAGLQDGVILLRGGPRSYVPEVLVGGMGAARQTSTGHRQLAGYWPHTASTTFVEDKGGIWSTDGDLTERVDEYAFVAPSISAETDHCCAIGPYLLVSRDNRLMCARRFGSVAGNQGFAEVGWTQLVTPETGPVLSMSILEDCLYFIQNGKVFRYALGVTAERGLVNGLPVTLRVTTPTVSDQKLYKEGTGHTKQQWHRIQLRLNGIRDAVLNRVQVRSGPFHTVPRKAGYDALSAPRPVSARSEVNLKAGGSSVELSITCELQGDVRLESINIVAHGTRLSR